MMEFEQMKKVWDQQKGETMYVINETAMHRNVTYKKNAARKKINREEISTSFIVGITAIIFIIAALRGGHNWAFISSGIMVSDLIYIQYFRWKRKKAGRMFDRSILGELDHTISNTDSMIRFYYFMIAGYLIPLCGLYILKTYIEGASLEKWIIMIGVPSLSILFMRWILGRILIYKKRHLLTLRKKLMEE